MQDGGHARSSCIHYAHSCPCRTPDYAAGMDTNEQIDFWQLPHADKTDVDTPALLVDLDALEANIARISAACRRSGINWRPHTKGIKVPQIARKLIDAGAIGITCAKLGEAEVMAARGFSDILIANQIVGPQKIARLVALRPKSDVMIAVDCRENVAAIADAARAAGVTIRVVIEVNMGMNRAGVEPGAGCLALARFIATQKGVRFAGLMGWEGQTAGIPDQKTKEAAVRAAVSAIVQTAEMCREAGLPVDIVSCGGTGTYWISAAQPGITEIQAGGGVFCDVHYAKDFGVAHPYALTIMTTVTSRPTPNRIVCDAGKKTMSSDAAVPEPLGLGTLRSVRLSAEHGAVELETPSETPRVGDRLEWVVGYSDTTVHLHDDIYATRRGRIEAVWPIVGRGRIR
jgi:D-serine deaminase-like pyridoxal phosphate-dependent protein